MKGEAGSEAWLGGKAGRERRAGAGVEAIIVAERRVSSPVVNSDGNW